MAWWWSKNMFWRLWKTIILPICLGLYQRGMSFLWLHVSLDSLTIVFSDWKDYGMYFMPQLWVTISVALTMDLSCSFQPTVKGSKQVISRGSNWRCDGLRMCSDWSATMRWSLGLSTKLQIDPHVEHLWAIFIWLTGSVLLIVLVRGWWCFSQIKWLDTC